MLAALGVYFVAFFFVFLGGVGLFAPAKVLRTFGVAVLPLEARNEVRAVYGGFSVALAALLAFSTTLPTERAAGIALAVAVALAGMAFGRIVSFAMERPKGFYPTWFFLLVELLLAALLLPAALGTTP